MDSLNVSAHEIRRKPILTGNSQGDRPVKAIFVHGVTVRQERYEQLLAAVKQGVSGVSPEISVDGFYWGDRGSSLHYGGSSIPGFGAGRRAVLEAAVEPARLTPQGQLLALALADPLAELQALKDPQEFNAAGAGFQPLPAGVEQRNQLLWQKLSTVTGALVAEPQLGPMLKARPGEAEVATLVRSSFEAAGQADRVLTVVDLLDPLIRSVTASLYRPLSDPGPALSPPVAWAFVEQAVERTLQHELGGQRGWLGDKLREKSQQALTAVLRYFRRQIMEAVALFVGDVLVYLAQRDAILADLDKRVTALVPAGESLWLIGHSLGGVICFDYCCQTDRAVARLVTVGSQVGLLGEWGALRATPPGGGAKITTPPKVGEWRNIYDPNDLLSFLAAPVFTNVQDLEFDTRAPFPPAHSEYWNCPTLYRRVVG